ncbi:hypothetical protein BDK89_2624 [Ilumatobacter fluminis]|uniref:Uncharacterized protein n=1 Tax=Ilumatobacter fluminis TaxID=467091 RepID=A0A4R7I386_9ACTN|nr:hypothetical protein BDK89_2624 [Ilumatobacter fluminis]
MRDTTHETIMDTTHDTMHDTVHLTSGALTTPTDDRHEPRWPR